jgi:ribose transport system ATP-binding protein
MFCYPGVNLDSDHHVINMLEAKGLTQPLLSVRGLHKSFSGVSVLKRIDLELQAGEVLSVVGENGAGKSTLMKVLAGVISSDAGQILIDGKTVEFNNPGEALQAGVVLIHQELNLCDNLTVAQNIFLGREPQRFGFVDSRTLEKDARQFIRQVGLHVSPRMIVGKLTIAKQQMVEIAKALSVRARVLIFDEPTSSLSAAESESLFELIEQLKQQGVGIIYISHRLAEVRRLSDRVQVLRDGEMAGMLPREEATHEKLVSLMVGRDLSSFYRRTRHSIGAPVLEVIDLSTSAWPNERVSFQVHAGEIVGLAGLVGSGRTELLETLFGIRQPIRGEVRIHGKPVKLKSPRSAVELGLAFVPEDRKRHGLVMEMDVRNNIGLVKLKRNQYPLGFANGRKQKQEASETINRLNIKTSSDRKLVKYLSGGNQQKIVIGKWLTMSPRVLLLDEPTRGIDIGAKQEIYGLIEKSAAASMAILCVSSELEEIIGLSDRVLVLREGRITGELAANEVNEEAIMKLATN